MSSYPLPLLTTEDVANMVGVSVRTVEDWRRDKVGPPFTRLGGRTIRYRRDLLEAWIDAGADDGGVEAAGQSVDG
jgi:excisionase family DNA binding protein